MQQQMRKSCATLWHGSTQLPEANKTAGGVEMFVLWQLRVNCCMRMFSEALCGYSW